MTQEEKAKAYDEALKVLHKYDGAPIMFTQDLKEEMFPELKESDDERIRKALIKFFTLSDDNADYQCCGVHYKDIVAYLEKQGKKTKPIEGFNTEFERQVSCLIASAMNRDYEYTKDFVKWTSDALLNYAKLEIEKNSMGISEATKKKLEDNLNKALEKETPESWNKFFEKQGEQKPVDVRTTGYWHVEDVEQKPAWTEKDEKMIGNIRRIIEQYAFSKSAVDVNGELCEKEFIDADNWLKSLKERVQPKQEWSEEDEEILNTIINHFKIDIECTDEDDIIKWLKSLKDRYTWKPSEEQLKSLKEVINAGHYTSYPFALETLYKQLKQL